MAAATHRVETCDSLVKLAVNDANADWFTSTEYSSLIYSHIVANSATHTFQAVKVGKLYTLPGFNCNPYCLLFDSDTTPFTGTNDVTYQTSARGVIEVITGTETATTISVSAATVNYAELMYDMYMWLAGHQLLRYSQAFGTEPAETYRALMQQAQHWLGWQ